jgi:hypothetical protein
VAGAEAEPSGQRADERVAAFLWHGRQIVERGFDGLEGAAVVEELAVALVDELQRVLGGAPVDRLHDRRGRLVTVTGREGEGCAQGLCVQRRVGAIAVDGAFGGGQDAGVLVVPDRLGGQAVLTRQIHWPHECTTDLRFIAMRAVIFTAKFT